MKKSILSIFAVIMLIAVVSMATFTHSYQNMNWDNEPTSKDYISAPLKLWMIEAETFINSGGLPNTSGSICNINASSNYATNINSGTSTGTISLGGSSAFVTIGGTITGASPLKFDGLTADAYKTTIAVTDPTANRTITLPDKSGIVRVSNVVALGVTGTLTTNLGTATVWTVTPTGAITLNDSAGPAASPGAIISIVVTTSGTNTFDITFGTGFKSTGALSTGADSGKVFTVNFCSDGTNWNEISRTTAM